MKPEILYTLESLLLSKRTMRFSQSSGLEKKGVVISSQSANSFSYDDLKKCAINQEIDEEINALIDALNQGADTFPDYFIQRCKMRSIRNADSCFSLFADPEGECNQLYINLVEILFQPQTLAALLHYLEPGITTLITPVRYATATSLDEHPTGEHIQLMKHSVQTLTQAPTTTELMYFAVAGPYLFDVRCLSEFSFSLHQRLHHELTLDYPDLAIKIYQQHNSDLSKLEEHILRVNGKGDTPLMVIKKCNLEYVKQDLFKNINLSPDTQKKPVYTDLLFYLDTVIEDEQKNKLLALTYYGSRYTLSSIIVDYLEGKKWTSLGCALLEDVIATPANQDLLTQLPSCSQRYLRMLNSQYDQHTPLSSCREKTSLPLPVYFFSIRALSRLNILKARDLLTLLLSSPLSSYSTLLQYAHINLTIFSHEVALAEMIRHEIFNPERLHAFNTAVVANSERLGGIHTLLAFAAYCNPDLIEMLLDTLPTEDRFSALLVAEERFGFNTYHIAARYAPSMRRILQLTLPQNRLQALFTASDSHWFVLHRAAWEADVSLSSIFELLSPYECHTAITKEDSNGHDLLCHVAYNYENLRLVLHKHPESDPVVVLRRKYADGTTIFHFAAGRCLESLKFLLGHFSKKTGLEILYEQDNSGRTALSYALGNLLDAAVLYILQLTPQEQRLNAMLTTSCSYNKSNLILHMARSRYFCDLLALLSKPDGVIAVMQVAQDGDNLFGRACANAKALAVIWDLYPEEKKLTDLLKKLRSFSIIKREFALDIIFHRLIPHPKSLAFILRAIQDPASCQKLLEIKNAFGQTAFHIATSNPRSLKIILNSCPPELIHNHLKEKDDFGCDVFYYANKYPKSERIIFDFLPDVPQGRKPLEIGFFSQAECSSEPASSTSSSSQIIVQGSSDHQRVQTRFFKEIPSDAKITTISTARHDNESIGRSPTHQRSNSL
ncbi:hypothetical protein [Legionella worsleiensis]|uniref:Ankyrin repeats (3 copies) n=1 Tax=Legionella worsleiensis TaxID=45076 RepID=A0A0W1AFE6_9GAMM|nr:hypothetical protein [Legionella worsleiensis]KTD79859.1 hypothetical protein Lwor_1373 [Legionella worsleiensis]STY32371.1 Uncharacterised protein [Legionella worsleiensis]